MSRAQITTLPQNQQIKKIFCAYHPAQFLTNFCCDMECLMPLCPNCIVEHTQQHFIQNNKPTYVNLLDAINDTKQKCYQNIIVFEELTKANDKIYDYVLGLRQSIHNQLMEDKQDIFRQIDALFETYEQKLVNETINKYKELQVYDRKETLNISEFIMEQIQILHDQINLLKGESCLAALINYYKSDGKIYEDSIKEIGQYMVKHKRAGKICINGDREKLVKTLDSFCQNNLLVQFINQDMAKEKQEENRLKHSNFSKEGNRSLAQRLSHKLISNISQSSKKQNMLNHSNQQYRNLVKRNEDYFKIDPMELKYSKAQNSISGSSYYQKQVGNRHRY